jgi:hypothetical protein
LYTKEYPLLVTFAGGLATTFPGTGTMESDFLVLGWEKGDYRTMLSDLSLVGILQAKQATEFFKNQCPFEYVKDINQQISLFTLSLAAFYHNKLNNRKSGNFL